MERQRKGVIRFLGFFGLGLRNNKNFSYTLLQFPASVYIIIIIIIIISRLIIFFYFTKKKNYRFFFL